MLKVFALLRAAAPSVVARTVSIPAVLVLHTDMEPFLFFRPPLLVAPVSNMTTAWLILANPPDDRLRGGRFGRCGFVDDGETWFSGICWWLQHGLS